MQIGKYHIRESRLPLLPIFVAGLVAGFFVIAVGKGVLLKDAGLLDEYTLYEMKYMTVDSGAYFWYVLRLRMGKLLLLAVLATTYLGLAVCVGCVFWYGMSAGAFLSAALVRYGIKGLFLGMAGVFPQYLVYVPAMYVLFLWCEDIYRGIYGRGHAALGEEMPRFVWRRALKLLLIILAFGAGCFLEGFVNPHIMGGLLKVF